MKCFIIALESEAEPIINGIKYAEKHERFGRKIVTGILYGEKVVAIVCGVGKVNAACAAQYAVDELGADVIINVGTAGGLKKDMQIGGIYSASAAVQYDFDLCALNNTKIGTLNEYSENYLPLELPPIYPAIKLATGDRFNDDEADFKLLTKELDADARDMEGGAIAQVCKRTGARCYCYKVISDLAGRGSTPEQFTLNLGKCFLTIERELENILKHSV